MNYKMIVLYIVGISFVFSVLIKILELNSVKREIPENVKDVYNKNTYQKWISYEKERIMVGVGKHIVVYLVTFLLIWFDTYAKMISDMNLVAQGDSCTMIIMVNLFIYTICTLPFEYICNIRIEEKYGFNRMTKKAFLKEQLLFLVLSFCIRFALMQIFIEFYTRFGIWSLAGIALLIVFFELYVYVKPKKMTDYSKYRDLPEGELRDRLLNVMKTNDCIVHAIKIAEGSKRSSKANAYYTSDGDLKIIVLSDTLFEQLDDNEIVAVFTHELGHNKYKDDMKQKLLRLIFFYVCVLILFGLVSLEQLYKYFGFCEVNYGFAFVLLINVCVPFLKPFYGLINYAFLRKMEYNADMFVVKNGYGSAFISALKKLSYNSFACLNPHPLVVKLTYSHPTLSQRIKAIYNQL